MRTRPRRFVGVASVLVDVILYVDTLPERGGDRLARRGNLTAGGTFNLLAAAWRLGLPAAYGGLVGQGPLGQIVIAALAAEGVTLLAPPVPEGDTGFDVALVEGDGERTFVTAPGCEAHMTREHLESLQLQAGDAVYVSGYDLCYPGSGPALAQWIGGLPEDCLLVFDPGPLVGEIAADRREAALDRADLLSLNRREAGILTGRPDPAVAAREIRGLVHGDACVVVRDGPRGAWLAQAGGAPLHVPARPVQAVDSTGAGDVHTAALVARIAAGSDVGRATWEANVAAAIAVGREGPSAGPTTAELEQALAQAGRGRPL